MKRTSTPACGYSQDTEILTRDGWVAFPQLTYLSEVATRSPDGRFEWQYPERITCEQYDGPMVELQNRTINLLVGPECPILIRRPGAYLRKHPNAAGRDWHFRAAARFAAEPSAQWELPASSSWQGTPAGDFELPGVKADRPHPAHESAARWLQGYLTDEWTPSRQVIEAAKAAGFGHTALDEGRKLLGIPTRRVGGVYRGHGERSRWETGLPTRELVPGTGRYAPLRGYRSQMKDFCAFLGLFVAEGWVHATNETIHIAQFETSRHLPEISAILGATGLRWSYNHQGQKFTASHRALARWLRANAGHRARNKRIPGTIKNLPAPLLDTMLRGMMIGDGHWGREGQRRYTTTSRQLADDVQEVFQKTGVDSYIRMTTVAEMSKYNGTLAARDIYVVHERMTGSHWLPRAGWRDYSGSVVSVKVPNGIVYVRRNDRPAWCGAALN